jgi:serine/threonine protein kinase
MTSRHPFSCVFMDDAGALLETDALSHSQSLFASGVLSVSSEMAGDTAELASFDNADYEVQDRLGEGSYGLVVSARCTSRSAAGCEEGVSVAVKAVSSAFKENTLLAKRTLREIWMLRRLRHDNVVAVLDFYSSADRKRLFMVLPLMDTDLQQVISSAQPLRTAHVVYLAYQILRGVEYLHGCGVLHRDLKPANVLVNEDCSVRIADLGMARLNGDSEEAHAADMTEYVVSRWWRGPEVMVNQQYSFPLDVWSVGCIVGEMLLRRPLFAGRDYADQLVKIVAVLGKPSREVIARMKDAGARDFVEALKYSPPVSWAKLLPKTVPETLALLEGCLAFEPQHRLTASQLLALPVFEKLVQSDPSDGAPSVPQQVLLQDWSEKEVSSVKEVEALLEKELLLAKQERDERMKGL